MRAVRAVLFDVDFTLCRPGPELSAERYARIAARHGVTLDPALYEQAREAAVLNLKRHPELLHDDSIWHRFTEEIFTGMGGPGDLASECATEIEQGWEVSENFELYEDALAALEELRKARLRGARLERVELYFCDLNEVDASEVSVRRTKVHGSEAMNAVFSGAQLAVTRFEDTKLYRARFDQALLVRVVFLDSRMGGPSLEKADFSGARLVDVSLRAANLQGASFAGATLVGVDFTDAALDGADFRGAVAIGCRFPAGFSP